MSGIEHASTQSIRPFRSCEEYLYAMKEDLAEWLKDLYGVDITVNNMVQALETGALLCAHANNVTRAADEFRHQHGRECAHLPSSGVTYMSSAQPATFLARDNVSNFINWCRNEMRIKDVLMFETDDLVLRKNEKNVVLCLLEVARRASRFGMSAPVLIQLEEEIEEEIREEKMESVVKRCLINTENLDEMVQYLISRCTCPSQFPMVKISEGKYRVGDSNTIIFVRILRNHVMVRVGGGWDTLEHYLDKHDPCRCTSLSHKLAQRPGTPVHEIKARQSGPDGQAMSQISLVLSRTQSPLDPVIWTSSGPTRIQRSEPGLRLRLRVPSQQTKSDIKDMLKSTCRTGREPSRVAPSPRVTSSLPRPARQSTPPPQETQRPSTPLVLQKVYSQTFTPPQQGRDNKPRQNLTKSQIVSKLRQNATTGPKNNKDLQSVPEKLGPSLAARPLQSVTPVQCLATNNSGLVRQQDIQDSGNARKSPGFIRTFSPTKGLMGVISGDGHTRLLALNEKGQSSDSPSPPTRLQINENSQQRSSSHGDRKHNLVLPKHTVLNSVIYSDFNRTIVEPSQPVTVVNAENKNRDTKRSYLFTPPPISPAQEAILYQSLEEEILFNLQQLGMDSDGGDSENEQDSSQPDTLMNSPEISHKIRQPSIHNTSSGGSRSSSRQTNTRDANFEAVIDELSKGRRPLEKVSVESWVNNFSKDLRGNKQESQTNTRNLNVFKPSVASSWSSLGSSIDSKESTEPSNTAEANNSETSNKEKPQVSSSYQRRSLKKPERVPSIYKLKLRPCMRPRRDNRPDKTPTKIPKPICYRSQSPEYTTQNTTSVMTDTQKGLNVSSSASTKRCSRKTHQTTSKFSATKCRGGDQEISANQELEFWV
ncbi:GAS2-like protein 2A [Tachysurus vachellii]|uniref:GAS2-like protein 2A n=1 Tax=Tachysurus vachellii TaxID=175792 RepID=UPI00296B10EF|nr:GAS2-like protein 2A [Tachysurus vachellii]